MRNPSSSVLATLRTVFEDGSSSSLSDHQLLERFLSRYDEAAELAFALLVRRHGPMVLRVARGILPDPHDADDAFQATFLVLVRKARAIRKRQSLASFLYGVSLRAARDIRAAAIRRRAHEGRAAVAAESTSREDPPEICEAVHEEVARLPERYRAPIVLCEFEGLSCDEAAVRLGCPAGTIKSRLSRGRARLRSRFLRRGIGPAALVGTTPVVREALADATAQVARRVAVGTHSAAVAERVARTMAAEQARAVVVSMVALATVLAVVGVVGSVGFPDALPAHGDVAGPPNEAVHPVVPIDDDDDDNDDIVGEFTGPSDDEIVALIKRIGRDEPTPALVAEITSYWRPRARQRSGYWDNLKMRVADSSFVARVDALARELTGKPADTRNLVVQAMHHHAGRQDELHRVEMRDDLARQAEPPKTLRGRVLDDRGKPVAGALVSAPGDVARTGPDGRFALKLHRRSVPYTTLYVEATGYGLTEANYLWDEIREDEDHEYRVSKQVTCGGRVLDPGGKPVAGAELQLVIDRAVIARDGSAGRVQSPGNAETLIARTDSEGRFDFRGIPAADNSPRPGYFIGMRVRHPRFRMTNLHASARNQPPPPSIDVTLRPGCTIAGLVRDDAGHPVRNAWVLATSSDRDNDRPDTHTDSEGRFRFGNLPPGEWTIKLEPEQLAMAVATTMVSLEAPVELRITAPCGGYIAGKVIGPNGKLAANAAVGWASPIDKDGTPAKSPHPDRITHTDSNGSFRLGPVPEGRYKILGLIDPPRSEAYAVGKTGDTDLVIRHAASVR